MTIDEAIEILQDLDTTLPQSEPELRREAVQLGIEALKCVKNNRSFGVPNSVNPLPGEVSPAPIIKVKKPA